MSDLPICEYRQSSPFADRPHFCQHTKLQGGDNLKTDAQCSRCCWFDKPCDAPRPVPDWETWQPTPVTATRRGLGDWIAVALGWFGIHKKPGGCTPCDERQANLNSWGEKVKRLLGG